jgi:PP-loop superfamily ATP-utilizing enzyme
VLAKAQAPRNGDTGQEHKPCGGDSGGASEAPVAPGQLREAVDGPVGQGARCREPERPGLQAARELGVSSPLLAAGLNKAAIRALSQSLGLPWQKPSQSCLATRFPYGATLTREALERVGRGEAWLRARGFSRLRLRAPAEGRARLELALEEWPAFLAPEVRGPFHSVLQRLGFGQWSLDLPG